MHCNENELVGYQGDDLSKQTIFYRGSWWFVKRKPNNGKNEKIRDILAFELGKEWTNVAETIPLNEELEELITKKEIFENFDDNNTWLVRLGQHYPKGDIKIKNLDQAVATELVYSLWIRRRDSHSYNRAYSYELPIFFDHQIAFLGNNEPEMADIDRFFHNPSPGYPGAWRIKEKQFELTTESVRQYEKNIKHPFSVHFVNNIRRCESFIFKAVDYIKKLKIEPMHKEIFDAGFTGDEIEKVYEYLKMNKSNIESETNKMLEVIRKPF